MKRLATLAAVAALFLSGAFAAGQTSKVGAPSYLVPYVGSIQLPASKTAAMICDGFHVGVLRLVTDATTPTFNATITGGGAVAVPAYCNGTNWVSF